MSNQELKQNIYDKLQELKPLLDERIKDIYVNDTQDDDFHFLVISREINLIF